MTGPVSISDAVAVPPAGLERLLESYEKQLGDQKTARAAHTGTIVTLGKLGRYADALAASENLLREFPSDAPAHILQGRCLVALRRFDEAVVAFRCALAIEPRLPEAWQNLGVVLGRLGNVEDAFRCYDRAAGKFEEQKSLAPSVPSSDEFKRHFHELMAVLHDRGRGCVRVTVPLPFAFKTSLHLLRMLLVAYDMDGVVVASSRPAEFYRKVVESRMKTAHPPFYIDLASSAGPQKTDDDFIQLPMFEPDRMDAAVRTGLQKVAEKYGGEEHFVVFDDLTVMESYWGPDTVKRFATTFFREMSELNIFGFVIVPDEKSSVLLGGLTSSCANRFAVNPGWLA